MMEDKTTTTTTTDDDDINNVQVTTVEDNVVVVDVEGEGTTTTRRTLPPPLLQGEQDIKLGKICCGCCFDYRRATIIMCILYLMFVGMLFGLVVDIRNMIHTDPTFWDIEIVSIVLTLLDITLGSILGILGAKKYKLCYSYTSVVWLCLRFLYYIVILIGIAIFEGITQYTDVLIFFITSTVLRS